MKGVCCVPECENDLREAHKFPEDSKLKSKWLKAIKRVGWVPKKWSRLCSAHFDKKDFVSSNVLGMYI